jgi:hypothetical protein
MCVAYKINDLSRFQILVKSIVKIWPNMHHSEVGFILAIFQIINFEKLQLFMQLFLHSIMDMNLTYKLYFKRFKRGR